MRCICVRVFVCTCTSNTRVCGNDGQEAHTGAAIRVRDPASPHQSPSLLPVPFLPLSSLPGTVQRSRQPSPLPAWLEEDAGLQLPSLGCPCAVVCQLCTPITMNATIWYATWTS